MPFSISDFGYMLSVATIRFEDWFRASKKHGIGEVGWHIQDMPCTCQLPWLAVEWPWSALAGPSLTLLAQIGVETTPLPLAPFFEVRIKEALVQVSSAKH